MGKKVAMAAVQQEVIAPLLKLDLGCGTRPKEGFIGVDVKAFPGINMQVINLAEEVEPAYERTSEVVMSGFEYHYKAWPWADDSVDEVYCSHFLEHLVAPQRAHFVNELYRVMKPDTTCQLIVPHWNSHRAYGDLTHQWPPVSEMWFYYLSEEWRQREAPHNDFYRCNFACTWGYSLRPELAQRAEDYRNYALANYRDAVWDIIATMTKAVPKQTQT